MKKFVKLKIKVSKIQQIAPKKCPELKQSSQAIMNLFKMRILIHLRKYNKDLKK